MDLRAVLATLLLALVTAGCKKEISRDFRVPSPLVTPLPFTVGVYYHDDLLGAHVTNEPPIEIDFIIFTGRANVSLYNQLFSDIFLEAIPLESRLSEAEVGEELDAVIEPKIITFSYDWDVHSGAVFVDINYSYTLYSPNGEQLNQWSVNGFGRSSEGIGVYNVLDNSIEAAMRDAAAKLVVVMYQDPSIRRCLERVSRAPGFKSSIQECFSE